MKRFLVFMVLVMSIATLRSDAPPVAYFGHSTRNGALQLEKVISPSSFSSQQNNYSPTGLADAGTLRLTASAPSDITGLDATNAIGGQIKIIHNIGSNTITLKDHSASSSAGNKFEMEGDMPIPTDGMIMLQYDGPSACWRATRFIASVGSVADSAVTFSDITTNNSSTSQHGFLKKLDNNAAHYMDGTGAWSTPSGGAANLVVLTAKGFNIVSSGAPTDATTISVPAGITRYRVPVTSAGNSYNAILVETQTGSLAAGTIAVFDTAAGGGNQVMATTAPPVSATTITSAGWAASSNTAVY